jgi:hypothetical protein
MPHFVRPVSTKSRQGGNDCGSALHGLAAMQFRSLTECGLRDRLAEEATAHGETPHDTVAPVALD